VNGYGKSAIHYYSHNGSWGGQDPKDVINEIMQNAKAESVVDNLKDRILEAIAKKKAR
jgi:hypothetical protein